MLTFADHWLDTYVIDWIRAWFPDDSIWHHDFNVRALVAIIMVSLVCGSVGTLVVSNRMAFFSDALAHCAFAGVAFGLLIALLVGIEDKAFHRWLILVQVGFGIIFGLLIAYVHERSSLANDTVIGVFFAGALGLGAVFVRAVRGRKVFDLESFIFGSPITVQAEHLVWLFVLLLLTIAFLVCFYNSLIFGSFNASLARSRRVPARLARYLFVVLLGIIVNLCQHTVGILLINGLLIVPAATASNLSGNLRQLLWRSIAIAMLCGVVGLVFSVEFNNYLANRGSQFALGIGGTVLVLSVIIFILSLVVGRIVRRWGGNRGY